MMDRITTLCDPFRILEEAKAQENLEKKYSD